MQRLGAVPHHEARATNLRHFQRSAIVPQLLVKRSRSSDANCSRRSTKLVLLIHADELTIQTQLAPHNTKRTMNILKRPPTSHTPYPCTECHQTLIQPYFLIRHVIGTNSTLSCFTRTKCHTFHHSTATRWSRPPFTLPTIPPIPHTRIPIAFPFAQSYASIASIASIVQSS